MANTENTGTSTNGIPNLVTVPRQSQIHAPVDATNPSQAGQTPRASFFITGSPTGSPSQHNLPLRSNKNGPSMYGRQRVRSMDSVEVPLSTPRPYKTFVTSFVTPPRRSNAEARVREDNPGFGTFSDEYDLSHEDPRILQDVQRALKLKARREARTQATIPTARSEMENANLSSINSPLSQTIFPMNAASTSPRNASLSSDVDFSPLTGAASVHPIPTSLDNGFTLDWSGLAFKERPERRWKLSTTKRREKEQLPHLNLAMDQLEKTHSDKITRIKTVASPQTLRKAKITREQLGRRYNIIYALSPPVNIARVARWYGSQEPVVRSSLEKAEPFTWLKHLERRNTRPPERSPRHLSALIMEEYAHAQLYRDPMKPISEDSALPNFTPDISNSPSLINAQQFSSRSRASSHYSVGPFSARLRSSEGQISFEPLVESTRNSLEAESLRSGESSRSSLISGSSLNATYSTKNHVQARDFALRIPEQPTLDKDVFSPTEEYISELNYKLGAPRLSSAETGPEPTKVIVSEEPSEVISELESETKPPMLATEMAEDIHEPTFPMSPGPHRYGSVDRVSRRQGGLTSLPSSRRFSRLREDNRQREADEEKAHERKTRFLEEATTHNHRIRQLLNRIAVSVREYESAQSNAMVSLGISNKAFPRELLDAFGHDPAAVTGATRRYQGWRAVDDIHRRLVRQREVFRTFLSHKNADMSISKSVLDDPISSLVLSLSELEVHNRVIARRAAEAEEILMSVQKIHPSVKADYKSTLSHTSVVYPELSYIVALEESYKDQYQQFWEFGMDTLTFLLDRVTPFWRTYGKFIGDDVRDFLIIPLYRNEFTGEARKYPIRKVPGRSCRHWLGLALFSLTSVAISFLQVRAAISSTAYYKLPMIPYEGIRWMALPFFWFCIIIQWWAVALESVIVAMQLGIVMWWAAWSVGVFT